MMPPQKLLDLVTRFQNNLEAYRAGQYNETQVRREFIDPLLKTLGWDVDNEAGYAEAYKDVVHEDAIRVGGAVKAPDYSCRIGGQRKFFVEAKKPAVNIKEDIHPAYQLRRYAWSAKLPLSILTDFEEFAVYDCRVKPEKTDKASAARLMYFRFTDYAEKWGEIAAIFSPEAIRKGSFDKFAHEKKGQRGTAEVDTAFLQEISTWRDELAANIALRNKERKLKSRDLSFAVQSTIDRLIFLRIAEDRGIEPYGRLRDMAAGKEVYARLADIFRLADAKYNSGLFHFQPEKGRDDGSLDRLTLSLVIDDKVLKGIIGRLYYPDSPYQFDVIPADILGQVYEQFLGKVIRLTVKGQAKVEEKPEVKKAGGVYYTPTYIVQYIVQQTVGKLLGEAGSTQYTVNSHLRVLDPACGSGSFLLGAYQFLLDWYVGQYNQQPDKWLKGKNPRIFDDGKGNLRLTIGERKRILLAHIYGVDIDPQAVEVTKLSLLLKVLEGETAQTLGVQMALLPERVLPDLSRNIQCGNSLIGPDFYDGQQLGLAGIADEEEFYRINAFDWQAAFPEVMGQGGFDVVIGNPPYILISDDLHSPLVIDYLKKFDVSQYKTDLFHLFIQRGIELIKPKGVLGYIVPNTWLTLKFTEKLRGYVLKHSTISEIVVFDHLVFQSANVYTALIFLEKRRPQPQDNVIVKKPQGAGSTPEIQNTPIDLVTQESWAINEGYRFEIRQIGRIGEIIKRLINRHPPLSLIARASLGCQAYNSSKHSPEQIANRVFHADDRLSEEYLPELAGKDVDRYIINRVRGKWIKYGPWLHDYRTMDWLQGPRILIREIANKPPYSICACYVEETYCNYKTILNVNPSSTTPFSMKYLLGLLNSRLFSFLYPHISDKIVADSFPRLTVGDVKRLPVRNINLADIEDRSLHDKIVFLVESMLAVHQRLQEAHTAHEKTVLQRQIAATDRQIDQLVYQLYHLTPEEIALIETP